MNKSPGPDGHHPLILKEIAEAIAEPLSIIFNKSFNEECLPEAWKEAHVVVVIDLPLLRLAVEGSDNPVSLEKPCQASLPPDQQGRHSLGRHPEVQYVA